jgi:hypothetical protein
MQQPVLMLLICLLLFDCYFNIHAGTVPATSPSWTGESSFSDSVLGTDSEHIIEEQIHDSNDSGKIFVGFDLYYSQEARREDLYGLVMDNIMQTMLPVGENQSLIRVQLFVCFHALDESLPLILDTDIQAALRDRQMYLLFPSPKESFCGERYLPVADDVESTAARVSITITDIVLQAHPRWGGSAEPLGGVLRGVTLCVLDSASHAASHRLRGDDEPMFDWHFLPSPGASVVNSTTSSTNTSSSTSSSTSSKTQCAFHYPMDGITLYPSSWSRAAERAVPLTSLQTAGEPRPYATHIFLYVKLEEALIDMQDPDNSTLVVSLRSVAMDLEYEFPLSLVSSYFGQIAMFQAEALPGEAYRTADLRLSLKRVPSGAGAGAGAEVNEELCSQQIEFFLAQQPYALLESHEAEAPRQRGGSAQARNHPPGGLLQDSSRADFPSLLRALGMGAEDVSVEIGTWVGSYSRVFLARWPEGGAHVCVDPWEQYEEYLDMVNDDQEVQHLRYLEALEALRPEGSRVAVMRTTSVLAASVLAPESVSFVYVDGDHSYAGAMRDVRAWWPKLRPGGVLAGHDFDFKGNN